MFRKRKELQKLNESIRENQEELINDLNDAVNHRRTSLRIQITLPIAILILLLYVVSTGVLMRSSRNYYYNARFREADRIAQYAAAELEEYEQLDWLCDYWEEHCDDMVFFYNDKKQFQARNRIVNQQVSDLTELSKLSDRQLGQLDEEGQLAYAELCYSTLCDAFDTIKRIYEPLFLYSFRLKDGEMFYFVTGTLEGEERGRSRYDDVYNLGSRSQYHAGRYPALDHVLTTGEAPEKLELSTNRGANSRVVHVFRPVHDGDKFVAVLGIGILQEELQWNTRQVTLFFIIIFTIMVLLTGAVIQILLRHYVILPLQKETRIIRKYEADKDSGSVVQELAAINSRNEIEAMAESFSSMIGEIDRYTQEMISAAEEREKAASELNIAARIQKDALPEAFFRVSGTPGCNVYSSISPAREVAGDFYDHFMIDDDLMGLTIADVSGKGIPAAMFMMAVKTLLKVLSSQSLSPSQVVESVNRQLCENNSEMMFVTVWFGIYSISERKLTYVNAGHEYPAVYRKKDGAYSLIIEKHDMLLGIEEELTFTEREITLEPGDRLFLFTDGVPEATNPDKELYGTDRMLACLNSTATLEGEEMLKRIVQDTDAFSGEAQQFDDLTMILLDVT